MGSYIAIDLKSYYASVECVDRGLDPLTARLVVADETRTDKTICLAVSPALKAMGISGRPRLFEVKQRLAEIQAATGRTVQYVIAAPRMARYLEVSAAIYAVYLRYVAPEDIHVYSVDEVFIDASKYLKLYKTTARELAIRMIRDVLAATGITATAGVGANLYLAKVAMDILAKKSPAGPDGVRIAELDEAGYRRTLWDHRPLTDFWMVGQGISGRLAQQGLYTMGDVARCSLGSRSDWHNEETLYRLFGVNAELLIDHAWGIEPCTMEDIKRYRPSAHSKGIGQVLPRPYPFDQGRIIVQEMTRQLVLALVERELLTDAIVLHVGYDRENVETGRYHGQTKPDHYHRQIPRSAHGTASLGTQTASISCAMRAVLGLYDQIVDPRLTIRRVNVTAIRVVSEASVPPQLDLFADYGRLEREKSLQKTILGLQKRFGKNAVLQGNDLREGATLIERNQQIGGHRA